MRPTFLLLFTLSSLSSVYGQAGYGAWRPLASMPSARQEVSTAVFNGRVYVIAGFTSTGASTNTVEAYDPESNTWFAAESIPILNNHNNAAVADGVLYTFGGVSNATYRYNPQTGIWATMAPSYFQHGGTAAVGVINNKIYVAGGNGGTMMQNEAEVFDPENNQWLILPSMNVPRNHTAGAVINGKFYVVGGRGSPNADRALEVYDPATNMWTILAPMPTGRSGIAVAAVNGQLWVFGGEIPVLHPEVEIYNPVSNTWRRIQDMRTPRHGIWASVIGNKIYLPAGGIVQGFGATNINEVFTVANVPGDFDGDGKTDVSVFRPADGTWYLNRSTAGFASLRWGVSTDEIAPADYDGDGKTDLGVFRPTADPALPDFYVLNSSNFSFSAYSWGLVSDVSVVNDYDGDARDDIAVYRSSNRTWYVLKSSDGGLQTFTGSSGAAPVSGDFDGDGKGDFTIFQSGEWFIAQSSMNYQLSIAGFGLPTDRLVPCDYDGDGKDNLAVFRPSTGTWHIRRPDQGTTTVQWGISTDVPTPGDYDGDGRCDVAVYRDGTWWINRSTAGVFVTRFGLGGDRPVPNRYLP
jgi:N-acetylneuraminic acid mutarotase